MADFEYIGPVPRFEFRGRYIKNKFSNMDSVDRDRPLIRNGIQFYTVENAYQAAKAPD
jgi:hypothetical protein